MAESSRTINHKLNELLSKNNISKSKLDTPTAINYANVLKGNILGKDKQEKVNSIVVLAKLLDCIVGSDSVSNDFTSILDYSLFTTLFSIVSSNMSTETYKAILKISVILISGSIFKLKDDSIDKYLPLYESLIEYLDVIDIMTQKLYLQDNKITYNTIKLVNDLINKALKFQYNGIITLAGRLKHVTLFSTIGNLIETDDKLILDSIANLKISYYKLNEFLDKTKFDLSIKSHQVMLNNLFMFLEVSLNEFGTPAKPEEYVKAGFTDNPRKFVVDNFTILLAMDLKIFLKDPNMTFKKKFHEELMMSNHGRTFPLYLFIKRATELWIDIFHKKHVYPNICKNILSWELMIYYTMNSCLILWQETKAQLNNPNDIDSIMGLIKDNMDIIENNLANFSSGSSLDTNSIATSQHSVNSGSTTTGSSRKIGNNANGDLTIEECLNLTGTGVTDLAIDDDDKKESAKSGTQLRHNQITKIKSLFSDKWDSRFTEFNRHLALEVMDFVCEQRVIQLLKGSWVYTESHGELLMKGGSKRLIPLMKYYFVLLSPNRQNLYYKEFAEKPTINPSYEEMEQQAIRLADIVDLKSIKIGDQVGEEDKLKNNRLISIQGTISYEKIILFGANQKKLLSFYTDTEVLKYVWLDGLKMLKGMLKQGQLSSDTEFQLDSLIDIRRNTQLLNLEDIKSKVVVSESKSLSSDPEDGDISDATDEFDAINDESGEDDDDDEEYYDINELTSVTNDTYYYV